MPKKIFATRILILVLGCAMLTPAWGEEPSMLAKAESYQLKNGLTIITKEVHSAPVTSVFMWYRVGARDDPDQSAGLAHFLEHMLFKGTQRFPKGEIARVISRTGGNQNAFTSYDYTAYFETVPAAGLETALEIEADRMQNALLDAKEIEQERTVILSELDGNRNNPQVRFRDLVNAQTWIKHPYRRPVIGWREDVERITPEGMRKFYITYYQPQNATLVVAGDFQPDRLRQLIGRTFDKIKPGPNLPETVTLPETRQGERRVIFRDPGPALLVQINLPVPPAGNPDHYVLAVLDDVLAKGKTARLYQALVEKGLASEVDSDLYEMIDSGVWIFSAACQPGVEPRQVEKVIRQEFERARQELLSPREFTRSVNRARAELIFSKDSLTDQAMLLGFYQTVARDWHLLDLYPERIAGVTPEQVKQIARQYLDPDKMTIGHFYPLPGGKPGTLSRGSSDVVNCLPPRSREQTFELAGPAPAPANGASAPARCQRFMLANGLVLLVQPNPSNPTLALSGLVRAGMVSEPAEISGLSIVHSQMLDRGTAKRTALQIAEALESKAASLRFSVSAEELNLSGQALAEDLKLILEVLAESLQAPSFSESELKKLRKKILADCQIAKDSTSLQAWQGFNELAYPPGHPLRRSILNAESGVRRLSRKDLQVYHQQWIRPENTILSLAGAVDPEQVHQLVKKLFADWQVSRPAVPLSYEPMRPITQIAAVQKTLMGKSECIAILGHEGIFRKDPEYYDAFVSNQILGGSGLSSRLMRVVRDEAGLTYSIYSQFKFAHGQRPWCIIFQADPKKIPQTVTLALQQVQAIQQGKVLERELDDTREQLVGELSLSLETNAGMAYLNREVEYHELGPNYLESYPLAIRSVTLEKVLRAAKKWFHPESYLLSIAGPKAPTNAE